MPTAGRYGIAPEATSVAANVTVTQPGSGGYVTVWPCGEPKPWASNLNFVAGQTVPNAVIAGVGEDGSICLSSTVGTHLVVDIGGYATDTRVDGDVRNCRPRRRCQSGSGSPGRWWLSCCHTRRTGTPGG